MLDDYLDQPLICADAIGKVARFVDDEGRVDRNKVYHALLNGYLDASKMGGLWVSTPRRILHAFMGGSK